LLVALLAACDLVPDPKGSESRSASAAVANARQMRRACASQVTFDRLKALAFDDALKVREGGQTVLDALAARSVLRMEGPVAKSRDDELNVTVCSGRMVIELPPGIEDAIGGERRLAANVEYSAQEAADCSGLVYQLQGAEPIIYRLAAIDLKRNRVGGGVEVATLTTPTPTPAPQAAPPVQSAPQAPPVTLAPPIARPQPRREQVARNEPVPAPAPRPERRPSAAAPERRPQVAAVEPAARPAPRRAPVDVAEAPRQARAAARPSFNCRNARSRSERLVCGSDSLAQRDRAMSSEFYAALANADPQARRELRVTRDRFLRDRDRCSSAACVASAYANRVEEIRAIRAD
jgi:hypothetical protein